MGSARGAHGAGCGAGMTGTCFTGSVSFHIAAGCVAQGRDDQGLDSDTNSSRVSRLLEQARNCSLGFHMNPPSLFFFFNPFVQKVLLSGSIKFSANVKFSKVIQKKELKKTLQDSRDYRKNIVQNRR